MLSRKCRMAMMIHFNDNFESISKYRTLRKDKLHLLSEVKRVGIRSSLGKAASKANSLFLYVSVGVVVWWVGTMSWNGESRNFVTKLENWSYPGTKGDRTRVDSLDNFRILQVRLWSILVLQYTIRPQMICQVWKISMNGFGQCLNVVPFSLGIFRAVLDAERLEAWPFCRVDLKHNTEETGCGGDPPCGGTCRAADQVSCFVGQPGCGGSHHSWMNRN